MKRTLMSAVAAIALVAPLATVPSFASAAPMVQAGVQLDRNDRNGDDRGYDNNRRADNDRRDNVRDDRRHDDSDRDNRNYNSNRWNDSAHNGYKYKGRWYYGPPPRGYESRRGVEVGYQNWRRGQRLPSYYRERYREVDYRTERYRAPPRGYHYVRDDRGDTLLVGIATGAILSVILSGR
jgi:Ni/Co efflux regulator RcnB